MKYWENFVFKVTGDRVFTTYLMDCEANVIQNPQKKTGVGLLLQGQMGCGKSAIFDHWRKIVGKDVSSQTGKPNEDYFSRFSTGLKSAVLAQVRLILTM
jgi:ABC-type thiamine transport system substrate-binding protein